MKLRNILNEIKIESISEQDFKKLKGLYFDYLVSMKNYYAISNQHDYSLKSDERRLLSMSTRKFNKYYKFKDLLGLDSSEMNDTTTDWSAEFRKKV